LIKEGHFCQAINGETRGSKDGTSGFDCHDEGEEVGEVHSIEI